MISNFETLKPKDRDMLSVIHFPIGAPIMHGSATGFVSWDSASFACLHLWDYQAKKGYLCGAYYRQPSSNNVIMPYVGRFGINLGNGVYDKKISSVEDLHIIDPFFSLFQEFEFNEINLVSGSPLYHYATASFGDVEGVGFAIAEGENLSNLYSSIRRYTYLISSLKIPVSPFYPNANSFTAGALSYSGISYLDFYHKVANFENEKTGFRFFAIGFEKIDLSGYSATTNNTINSYRDVDGLLRPLSTFIWSEERALDIRLTKQVREQSNVFPLNAFFQYSEDIKKKFANDHMQAMVKIKGVAPAINYPLFPR